MAYSCVTLHHENHTNSDKILKEIRETDSRKKLRNDNTEARLHGGKPMGNAYLIETL